MTSPWNSVLNTNYAPSDDEATRIRAFCEKPQQKVFEIDHEIQKLREKLDGLLHERDVLLNTLESHRALVSPIRRVSPELLQQIFLFCLPAGHNPVVHPSEAPLLLGRICRLWREVANGTPQLWSAIHIVIPSNDNSSLTSKRYEALLTWLGRSGVTPLHISLRAHLPSEDILPFVDHIAGLSTRWASVMLALPNAVMLRLCSRVNGSVLNLNTVKFDCLDMAPYSSSWEHQPETTDLTYVISQFVLMNPSVCHYSLRQQSTGGQWGHTIGDAFTQLFLSPESSQSSKLETLTLTLPLAIMFTGLRPILDLLSGLPHLKQCSLKCYVERGISETLLRPKPVALNALEELSLCITMRNEWTDEHGHLLPDLFANLLLPRLTDIRLSGIISNPTETFTGFAQLLIRSSASLKKLSLLGLHKRSDGLEALATALEACPQLQELTVLEEKTSWGDPWEGDPSLNPWTSRQGHSKLGLGDQVLKALSTPSVSMTLLCPKLDKLNLILSTASGPTESYLKSFLTVRRLSPVQCTPLASFCVQTPDGLEPWSSKSMLVPIVQKFTDEVESIMDELKQDGMTLDISNPIVKWVASSSPYLGLETPNDQNDDVQ